jgi:hypothetical protein
LRAAGRVFLARPQAWTARAQPTPLQWRCCTRPSAAGGCGASHCFPSGSAGQPARGACDRVSHFSAVDKPPRACLRGRQWQPILIHDSPIPPVVSSPQATAPSSGAVTAFLRMLWRSSHLTKGADQRVVGLWWPALILTDMSCGLVSCSVSGVSVHVEIIKGLFLWDPGGARSWHAPPCMATMETQFRMRLPMCLHRMAFIF